MTILVYHTLDEIVREYIRNQELEDIKEDQTSKREYSASFKKTKKKPLVSGCK